MRLRFSSFSECGTFPVVQQRLTHSATCAEDRRFHGTGAPLGGLSFSRRRLGEEGGSSSFRLEVGGRGSSHR